MPIFAGLDRDEFPGVENMALLRAKTNLAFTGFYLAPAPSHHDTGWMTHRAELEAQGWGLIPTYVGRQIVGPGVHIDPSVPSSQGQVDGNNACDLMLKAGFETGRYVYLDLENGPPLSATVRLYVQAWVQAVRRRQFCPAVYCSHLLADSISQIAPGARVWAVKVKSTDKHDASAYGHTFPTYDPHASGFQYAYVWQHEQNAVIEVDGVQMDVDLNVAVLKDPSR